MWTYKAKADRPQPPSRIPADAWPQGKAGPTGPPPAAAPPQQISPAQQATRFVPPVTQQNGPKQAGQPQLQNKQPQPVPQALKAAGDGWQERDWLSQPAQPQGPASNTAANAPQSTQNQDKQAQNPLKPPQNSALFPTRQFTLQYKLGQGFAFFYLLGLAGGSLVYTTLSGAANEYFTRFLEAIFQRRAAAPVQLFSSGFLTAFFQLTLVMLCGFFVFGGLFLALFCTLKGAVFGGLCAALLSRCGPQAALGIALLWLPETLQALLLILLSCSACTASLWLARLCFGAQQDLTRPLRPLLGRYTAVCLAAALPCALSVLLRLLFANLPGLG